MNPPGPRRPLPSGFERIATEMETYYRELPRLLDEGAVGKIALVRGDLVTVWDTTDDALQYAYLTYGLDHHCLCQPVDALDIDRLAPYLAPAGSATA